MVVIGRRLKSTVNILVDADPTINNSQVWSRGTASNLAMRPLSNLFDGSTDTSI